VRSILDELLPHFSSSQVNVGCDETVDLGNGRSKELVDEKGRGRVYLDFLLKIYHAVKARGLTMQFWGDIIVKHPDLVAELPRDLIALEWGYDENHPFDEHGAIFSSSGVPFYVCPGTSTWLTLAGRTDNAMRNLLSAGRNGLKHGAVGYLNTDWGDRGHWQPFPVSFLGFGYGAAICWAVETNADLDIAGILSRDIFLDTSGIMGQLVYDLGNTYQIPGVPSPNSNILVRVLQSSPEEMPEQLDFLEKWAGSKIDLQPSKIEETAAAIEEIMSRLPETAMQRPDSELIKREFTWAADMLRHGCHRAIWMLTGDGDTEALAQDADRLIVEYKKIWHLRSRPGGFADSVAGLEKMKSSYL
jgi:hypothetical protein